jgi:hypothetical protein
MPNKKLTDEELKLWREFDWDEYEDETSVLIKSQAKINVERANKLRGMNLSVEEREAMGKSQSRRFASMSTKEKLSYSQKRKDYIDNMTDEQKKDHAKKTSIGTLKSKEKWYTPEWIAQQGERNRKQMQTQKWKDGHAKGMANRYENYGWCKKNLKPIKTPYGVFKRSADAQEENRKQEPDTLMNKHRMSKLCKDPDNSEYYFITYDEYLDLTK